jgi:hypothetical protein
VPGGPRYLLRGLAVWCAITFVESLHGVGVRPMSQLCQVPETKAELARLIPPPGGLPPQPFLPGYTESAQDHTPRKKVEEVLK